jgi:hypothetical protein
MSGARTFIVGKRPELSTSKVVLAPKLTVGELVRVYASSLGVICAKAESTRKVVSRSASPTSLSAVSFGVLLKCVL